MSARDIWRRAAVEIRARSGLGSGRLELVLRVGDGTGRTWRRYMADSPPLPRNLPELLTRARQRSWIGDETVALLDPALQTPPPSPLPQPVKLPFATPPDPPDVLMAFVPRHHAQTAAHAAAYALYEAACRRLRMSAKTATRTRIWATRAHDHGGDWWRAVTAMSRLVPSRLPGPPGHPGREALRVQSAAEDALLEALRMAYERKWGNCGGVTQ